MLVLLVICFVLILPVFTGLVLHVREIDKDEYYRRIDNLSHGYYDEVED